MLLVGDRIVLRSPTPPEAAFGLFEIADIELRASEPGRVREHGYQTTAERARARLDQAGITVELAFRCAAAMQPVLAERYARGPLVRRIASRLKPSELLRSDLADATGHIFGGGFLDLEQLARDLGLPAGGVMLEALWLALLVHDEAPETILFLSTEAWTKYRKPGERTYRRPIFASARELEASLALLASRSVSHAVTASLSGAQVLAFVRALLRTELDEDTHALYTDIERRATGRDVPDRGPLADAALWALAMRMDAGELEGVVDEIDLVERAGGRTPGSTYLRARAALLLHLEPPKLIAERISALALSMTSFQELSLLAAEAWLEAGEGRRAAPYARDLVDAAAIDDALLLRAKHVLARAIGAAPVKHITVSESIPAPMPPSVRPPAALLDPPSLPFLPSFTLPENDARAIGTPKSRIPTAREGDRDAPRLQTSRGLGAVPGTSEHPLPMPEPPPIVASALLSAGPRPRRTPTQRDASRVSSLPPPTPIAWVPALHRDPPPTEPGASFTMELHGPEVPPPPKVPPELERTWRPRRSAAAVEQRTPSIVPDPRAEPESERETAAASEAPFDVSSRPTPLRPPTDFSFRVEMPTPLLDADLSPESRRHESARTKSYLHGSSQPPFRTEDSSPLLVRAPMFPKMGTDDELVETLALPPGLSMDMKLDGLPRSILEARVQFTLLARELGLDYRLQRNVALRADITGIEVMQAALFESHPDHVVHTPEEAWELRRHGALLAEILSRRLDAEWVDISPNELGDWSMIVPPDTRVWPFGRIARLVQMGHRERDLVSYFFELKSRARR